MQLQRLQERFCVALHLERLARCFLLLTLRAVIVPLPTATHCK
jgi:hypothetical protein